MARYATAAGDWNNPAIWDGGVNVPTVSEDVELNGWTVNINTNLKANSIKNTYPLVPAYSGSGNSALNQFGGGLQTTAAIVQKTGQITIDFITKPGTISISNGSSIVTGTGTNFQDPVNGFKVGDIIRIKGATTSNNPKIITYVHPTLQQLTVSGTYTSNLSGLNYGNYPKEITGTLTEFDQEFIQDIPIFSNLGGTTIIGNIDYVNTATQLFLKTEAFGTILSPVNLTNTINYYSYPSIYTIDGLTCVKGRVLGATTYYPLIAPNIAASRLIINSSLKSQGINAGSTALSSVMSYGGTNLAGNVYYIKGDITGGTSNSSPGILPVQGIGATTSAIVYVDGALTAGNGISSNAIAATYISVYGLTNGVVSLTSTGQAAVALAGSNSALDFKALSSLYILAVNLGSLAAITSTTTGNIELPLSPATCTIQASNSISAISSTTATVFVNTGLLFNTIYHYAIDARVYFDPSVQIYNNNTGPWVYQGAYRTIAEEVWDYFQNNPDALTYITRLHNAATVDTTGDQISLIP